MPNNITYGHATGPEWLKNLDEVTDLYLQIHADDDSSIYTREAFVERTTGQATRDGFGAVWARCEGALVGFAFGLRLPPGAWWAGKADTPPSKILQAPKFAVIELNVAAPWRGKGIGRTLHDKLLEARPEPYAILTTRPDRPARAMYARWGWTSIGTAQHAPDAPIMDQLVLRLHK